MKNKTSTRTPCPMPDRDHPRRVEPLRPPDIAIRSGALTDASNGFLHDLLERYDRVHLVVDRGLLSQRQDAREFVDAAVVTGRVGCIDLPGGERTKNFGTLRR